jgi:hypothetical protein
MILCIGEGTGNIWMRNGKSRNTHTRMLRGSVESIWIQSFRQRETDLVLLSLSCCWASSWSISCTS